MERDRIKFKSNVEGKIQFMNKLCTVKIDWCHLGLFGNKEIEKFNHSYLGSFLPGTVGIIAIIKDNKLFYGYIGDCIGILLNKQMKKEFTIQIVNSF